MRVPTIIALLGVVASCQPEEPTFGPPSSIKDRRFPGESPVTPSAFPAPFDAAAPPPEAALAPRHAAYAAVNERLDCMTCHTATGQAKNKPWLFGGHVSAASAAEVVLTTKDGKVLAHVKASTDGYVWAPLGASPLPSDARTAARTKDRETAMQSNVSTPACNATQCHGGATAPANVP